LGTRLGFGAAGALGDEAVAGLTPFGAEVPVPAAVAGDALDEAEPAEAPSVVEVGPATAVRVSDVLLFDVWVVEAVLLAAEAELAPLPVQAMATIAIETRIERYIFPSCGQRLKRGAEESFSVPSQYAF
jgi:hypothetical protein